MLVKSQVKYIQSLSQKKFRDEEDVFVAEGPKIINELLAGNAVPLQALYATEDWLSHHSGLIPPTASLATHQVTPSELERISFLSTPNEVLAIFKKPRFEPLEHNAGLTHRAAEANAVGGSSSSKQSSSPEISKLQKEPAGTGKTKAKVQPGAPDQSTVLDPSITLVLDNIQDPGNLGTIIRCADWFGVKRIICSPNSADNFSPKVVQSTMASIVRVAVYYTDLGAYLETKPAGPIYAAALNGKPLSELQAVSDATIIIGNESKGISDEILAFATERITIPRRGQAESLNAAVATGIILSHLLR